MFRRFAAVALTLSLIQLAGWGQKVCAAEMKPHPQLAVSVAFDADGRLWRVRVADGYPIIDVSDDRGRTYNTPVRATSVPEPIAADGEQRPEIVPGENGLIYVAWTSPLPQPYAGNIRFARSLDGGKSFGAPLTINDNRDAITHRFQTLHVAPDGRLTLVWIDKRDLETAKRTGGSYRGAALYYAVSDDGGASFRANHRLAAHSCECCRIALASDTDGRPVAFWRHVFADGTRDHALVRVGAVIDDRELPRATAERWQINACPHHGPDLAIAADGTRHGVWFNQVAGEPGLFYGAWNREGRPLAPALRFGEPNAAHPALLVLRSRMLVVWKAFDGEKTVVSLMESPDGGRHWSAPRAVAATADASDHPRLVAYRDEAYLSWSTSREGHRLVPLTAVKETSP